MNTLPADTAPVRRAALVAHALHSEDQAWLLQALEPAHRALLQPLLDDLRALGIPQDVAQPSVPVRSPPRVRAAKMPDAAQPADQPLRPEAQAVAHWLAREPASLRERILDLQPWPWAAEVRRRLGLSATPSQAPAPALDAWLRTQVADHLATLPAEPAESLLARWVRRMRERGHA